MLGKPVPDFSLPTTGGSSFRLTDQRGKRLALPFYPRIEFPFELGCDPDEKAVCGEFGVMKDKTLYGRKVRGIERSTFVLDQEGRLLREWRGVKVPGHVEEVLSFAKAL